MEKNKKTYSDKKVIEYYEKYEGLQKPEQSIFEILKKDLGNLKMLDIGIGAGRTTQHFAPFVKEYTGVDYAEGMVHACEKKFTGKFKNSVFQVADARKLDQFPDNKFDLVLFSFNGIDYMDSAERIETLKQISRVLVQGGYFFFSSHNIQSLDNPDKFKFRWNIPALLTQMLVWHKVKKMNASELAKVGTSDFISINDGVHGFGLQTHYFRPAAQERILESAGFKNIRFFSLESGLEISRKEISSSYDRWVYYFCNKS